MLPHPAAFQDGDATMKQSRKRLMLAAAVLAMSAGLAMGQATFETANIAQPHLAAARALAAQENGWRHPGLSTCYPDDEEVAASSAQIPAAPKMFDNLYFVGNTKYAVYALDTSEGIILFDSLNNQQQVEQFIIPALRKAGLDPARLKVLIISHGVGDHYGGGKYLQEKYGVRVYTSSADWDMAAKADQRQLTLPADKQRLAPHRDKEIKDGDTITLGDESIKTFVAPNALSLLVPVKDHGKPRLLAYFGGAIDLSPERQVQIVTDAKVDGYLGNHAIYNDAIYRLEYMRVHPDNPNPFLVGTADTIRFIQEVRECQLNIADVRAAMPSWRYNRH
jgi:metallo-beta-lactamase class B